MIVELVQPGSRDRRADGRADPERSGRQFLVASEALAEDVAV
jgi:hypothetical protein